MRLQIENKHAFNGYFVTLTYADPYNDDELHKEHLQDFIKTIRNLADYKRKTALTNIPPIKYFGVGEYGEQELRPHYHILLFNVPEKTRSKALTFIQKAWDMGFVVIDEINKTTIEYVCKYIFKQRYWNIKKQKPFRLMSTRPAIGSQYIDTHQDYHLKGEVFYRSEEGNKKHLPRFYTNKIFDDEYKERRREQAELFGEKLREKAINTEAKENVQKTTKTIIYNDQKQQSFIREIKRKKLN